MYYNINIIVYWHMRGHATMLVVVRTFVFSDVSTTCYISYVGMLTYIVVTPCISCQHESCINYVYENINRSVYWHMHDHAKSSDFVFDDVVPAYQLSCHAALYVTRLLI